MRIVLQRVKEASVAVNSRAISYIEEGFVLLVGVAADDTPVEAEKAAQKISRLRVFEDDNGKSDTIQLN